MFGKVVENMKEILDVNAINVLKLVPKIDLEKSLNISAFLAIQNVLHMLYFKINDQSSDKSKLLYIVLTMHRHCFKCFVDINSSSAQPCEIVISIILIY